MFEKKPRDKPGAESTVEGVEETTDLHNSLKCY
jgi:hypothetical protein